MGTRARADGGGLVVPDAGDGWDEPEVERYTVRREGPRVVVELDGEGGRSSLRIPCGYVGSTGSEPGFGSGVASAQM